MVDQERMYGKAEMGGEGGLFCVKARTVHVWRDRGQLPPPDNDGSPVNGSAAWRRSTLLRWAVETGRVDELRSPSDQSEAKRLHAEQALSGAQ